jgi:hypothetical protein
MYVGASKILIHNASRSNLIRNSFPPLPLGVEQGLLSHQNSRKGRIKGMDLATPSPTCLALGLAGRPAARVAKRYGVPAA